MRTWDDLYHDALDVLYYKYTYHYSLRIASVCLFCMQHHTIVTGKSWHAWHEWNCFWSLKSCLMSHGSGHTLWASLYTFLCCLHTSIFASTFTISSKRLAWLMKATKLPSLHIECSFNMGTASVLSSLCWAPLCITLLPVGTHVVITMYVVNGDYAHAADAFPPLGCVGYWSCQWRSECNDGWPTVAGQEEHPS